MSTPPDRLLAEQSAATDDSILAVHAQMRAQKPEKPHGYAATPLVLLGVMCAAIFFGSIYLAHYSIRFDPHVVNEVANRAKPGQVAVVVTRAMKGKPVYQQTCIACHQANGQGQAGIYPPLAGSEWINDPAREQQVIRIVLHGLNGPITVAGKEYNNVMAPLGEALNDEKIANVLSYVRAEWGNTGAGEVDPATVAAVRAATAGRKDMWTVKDLQAVK